MPLSDNRHFGTIRLNLGRVCRQHNIPPVGRKMEVPPPRLGRPTSSPQASGGTEHVAVPQRLGP
jgi:hypothetical protein